VILKFSSFFLLLLFFIPLPSFLLVEPVNAMMTMSVQQPNVQATKEIVCSLCHATFASRNQLFRHLRSDHEEDFSEDDDNDGNDMMMSARDRTAASIAVRASLYHAAHDAYYRTQIQASGIFSLEDWEQAMTYFRKPLPVAFRILTASSMPQNDARFQILQRLQTLVPPHALRSCLCLDPNFAQVAAIPPRQWSPEAQQALIDAQDVGVVNRQEICSMIPPLLLLLGLKEGNQDDNHHPKKNGLTVLDLCAAPGSKSLELLDLLHHHHQKQKQHNSKQQEDNPGILLVCNDTNRQRLSTVSKRCRRQPAHWQTCLILNSSDGRYFPALRKWGGYKLKFDGILADVPCSGDGTLRKLSAKEWQQWNVQTHLQLHKLQVRLLVRALQCVAKGGRVVYSTCSLDPMENEAVVVSAMARMEGGPSAYRIVPVDDQLLQSTAASPLQYSKGATHWVVPHPHFGKSAKKGQNNDQVTTTTVCWDTYESIHQVPPSLLKRDLTLSMFPPRARSEAQIKMMQQQQQTPNNSSRDILSSQDIAAFEEMLPHCCRILPQHLDSGGFFCAMIERVEPSYYPICYPLLRPQQQSKEEEEEEEEEEEGEGGEESIAKNMDGKHEKRKASEASHRPANPPPAASSSSSSFYHGRIVYPVQSASQIRALIQQDKDDGHEVYFEGVATKEHAIKWLFKHKSYIPGGISEEVVPPPESVLHTSSSSPEKEEEEEEKESARKRAKKSYWEKTGNKTTPIYTRLFQPPHPSLVKEFCDFFGLYADSQQAATAGVESFPVERLVVMGGGDDAIHVTTCLDPQEAHTIVRRDDASPPKPNDALNSNDTHTKQQKVHRRRRFIQLTLISEVLQSLYQGGAKFNPMEAGLSLCWVPIPGLYRADHNISNKQKQQHLEAKDSDGAAESLGQRDNAAPTVAGGDFTTRRAVKSGRFGLMDESVEYLGRCASKRLVALTRTEALEMLQTSRLNCRTAIKASDPSTIAVTSSSPWWIQWGKQRLADLEQWPLGAAIAVVEAGERSNDNIIAGGSTIFLPCVLRKDTEVDMMNGSLCLELLTEQRYSDPWKRLLESLGDCQ
jgi:16S rRNA C967 or C1407 C5-methylase (RsmB/RsmF family)